MGNNYYAIYNKCKCCNRFDSIHIGKSSFGWKFVFSALEYGTFEEWKYFLEEEGVSIIDEYGKVIDLKDFLEKVESKQNGETRTEDTYNYQDKDGYDFCNCEFS